MGPRTDTAPSAARADERVVGLLEVCELRGGEYAGHLSARERAKYVRLPGGGRKGEWLAGRLAAKYLFLSRLEGACRPRGEAPLLKLSAEALGAYSPWMYRAAEVLSDGGAPRLFWCGGERTERLSLSHTRGVAGACLTAGAPAAIDVETVAPRHGAFYRKNFTEAERRWAAGRAGGGAAGPDWCFTLLWALKESALKLGWLSQSSVWSFPRIQIGGLPDLDRVGPFCWTGALGDACASFTARVEEDSRVTHARVTAAGTRGLVLTTMSPLIGGFE
ncbi:MAG: 4'-phosphopantetheinyl transferase superfamily protein [Acidobacteria bacterium]|nr:4'-phosphopantetheinyl transferase superfamily protein [Acidobacteriota bacterium]